MQTIALDLKNNPELQSLVADMNPGDKIELVAAIKSKDDQSVTLTVETACECNDAEHAETMDETEGAAEEMTDTKPEAKAEAKGSKGKGIMVVIPDEPSA